MRARENRSGAAKNVALMGILFALAIAFSLLEGMLPPLIPVPGIKLGLSNVVVMYCVFALGAKRAYALACLKSLFTLFIRGAVAAGLSLAGGVLSVTVMLIALCVALLKDKPAAVSVLGAVSHNIGQLLLAGVILRFSEVFWYYLPVLTASGIIMGLFTALLLRAVRPLLKF